jgi:hypothetical protein
MKLNCYRHVAVTRLLLDAGADVLARCPSVTGHTAFELASLQMRVPSELLHLLAHRTLHAPLRPIFPSSLINQLGEAKTPQPRSKQMFLFPPAMVGKIFVIN